MRQMRLSEEAPEGVEKEVEARGPFTVEELQEAIETLSEAPTPREANGMVLTAKDLYMPKAFIDRVCARRTPMKDGGARRKAKSRRKATAKAKRLNRLRRGR